MLGPTSRLNEDDLRLLIAYPGLADAGVGEAIVDALLATDHDVDDEPTALQE